MAVVPSTTRSKVATEPGPVRHFESSECCVRSSGTYAAVPLEDLLEVDPQGKRKHPTAHPKLTTELDADQSSSLVRLT
jgi:hypothetical protein